MCADCAREKSHPQEQVVLYLLDKLIMQDNGCPLERHELRNSEWRWLGIVKDERLEVWKEEHPTKKPGAGAE